MDASFWRGPLMMAVSQRRIVHQRARARKRIFEKKKEPRRGGHKLIKHHDAGYFGLLCRGKLSSLHFSFVVRRWTG